MDARNTACTERVHSLDTSKKVENANRKFCEWVRIMDMIHDHDIESVAVFELLEASLALSIFYFLSPYLHTQKLKLQYT